MSKLRTSEKQKEYNKRAYEKHKEKRKEEARDYYHQNKEKVLDTVRDYRDKNRDLIREKGRHYYRRKLENRLLNAAKARAKAKNLEFNIEVSDIVVPKICPLLGIPIFVNEGKKVCKPNSPSLDRIDPTKGYIKNNVWVISLKANTMKSNATLEEMKTLVTNWILLDSCMFLIPEKETKL